MSLEAFMALEVFKPVRALPQASGAFVEALKILGSLERLISFCAPGIGLRVWAGRWGIGSAGWAWGLQGGCEADSRGTKNYAIFLFSIF